MVSAAEGSQPPKSPLAALKVVCMLGFLWNCEFGKLAKSYQISLQVVRLVMFVNCGKVAGRAPAKDEPIRQP